MHPYASVYYLHGGGAALFFALTAACIILTVASSIESSPAHIGLLELYKGTVLWEHRPYSVRRPCAFSVFPPFFCAIYFIAIWSDRVRMEEMFSRRFNGLHLILDLLAWPSLYLLLTVSAGAQSISEWILATSLALYASAARQIYLASSSGAPSFLFHGGGGGDRRRTYGRALEENAHLLLYGVCELVCWVALLLHHAAASTPVYPPLVLVAFGFASVFMAVRFINTAVAGWKGSSCASQRYETCEVAQMVNWVVSGSAACLCTALVLSIQYYDDDAD